MLWAEPEVKECSVLDYCQYIFPDMSVENSVIRKTTQHLTVWIREEMLFSESLELWEGDKAIIAIKDEYEDRNILCDEIILNEKYHFWLRGIRFLTLDLLYGHRKSLDDKEELRLINYFLNLKEMSKIH